MSESLTIPKYKIIGLSGHKQSGKDTILNSLIEHLWERRDRDHLVETVRFADPLKQICKICFGLTNEEIETEAGKQTIHKPSGMTVRQILQYVGTDVFRKLDQNCWTNAFLYHIHQCQAKRTLFIVPDVRFVNEVRTIQEHGGIVIRLLRCPFSDTHSSETSLDGFEGFDWVLDNSNMTISQQDDAVWTYLNRPGGYLDNGQAMQ